MRASELFDLTNQCALVTGASRGLGRQIAEGLAEMGARVGLCARNSERLEQTAEEFRQRGHAVLAQPCDVTCPEEIERLVEAVRRAWGRIDILVNNAGIVWASPAIQMALADWERVVKGNLTATFLCSQAVGKVMIEQQRGKIINVASVAALAGSPAEIADIIAYSASKAGILGLTRDLACKWACYNINVNALVPGWFRTHMTEWTLQHHRQEIRRWIPLGRFGGGDELKGAAIFLASEASRYITGQAVVVDGGLTAW